MIISNDASNKHLNRLQVVPLTANVDRFYSSEALVNPRGKYNKAIADQLTTVSELRLLERLGKLSNMGMARVERPLTPTLSQAGERENEQNASRLRAGERKKVSPGVMCE